MSDLPSPRFSLTSADWKKIGMGGLLALAGAAVVWLGQVEAQVDLGLWQPFVAAAVAVALNGLRKFIADNTLRSVVFVLCSGLLCASPASAQVARLTTQRCNGGSCTIGSGTCVNIGIRGDRAYFLTAGHCVLGSSRALIYLNRGTVEARIDAADETPDLALLSVPASDVDQTAFPLAEEVQESSFDFVGFSNGGPYIKRTARLIRRSGGFLICDVKTDSGDSGGPYLQNNRVAGIHMGFASDGRRATDCITIRRWLMGRVGFVPGTHPSLGPAPTPAPPQSPTVACRCSAEIAALKAEVAQLRAECNRPVDPVPQRPDMVELNRRLDELEKQIAAAKELAKRIDALEFKIAEVRLAGGKTDQLEKELADLRDKTFEVRSLAPDGKVVSSETIKLGDNINLRLVPKRQ